jgi:CheY-like chemotaxis protein
VVSDVVMPEMGGQALFHALRQRNSGVKMVMLSGHPPGGKLDDLRALGMSAWLPKPLNLDQLAQVVAQALERNPCAGETA